MNYREFTERVYNYKHGLTNSAESQNIQHSAKQNEENNESIEHSAQGDTWDQHKYKEKIYLGEGKFRYIYDDGTSSTGYKPLEYDDPSRQQQRAKPLVDNFNARQATKEQAAGISEHLKNNVQSPSNQAFVDGRNAAYQEENSKPVPYAQRAREQEQGKANEAKAIASGTITNRRYTDQEREEKLANAANGKYDLGFVEALQNVSSYLSDDEYNNEYTKYLNNPVEYIKTFDDSAYRDREAKAIALAGQQNQGKINEGKAAASATPSGNGAPSLLQTEVETLLRKAKVAGDAKKAEIAEGKKMAEQYGGTGGDTSKTSDSALGSKAAPDSAMQTQAPNYADALKETGANTVAPRQGAPYADLQAQSVTASRNASAQNIINTYMDGILDDVIIPLRNLGIPDDAIWAAIDKVETDVAGEGIANSLKDVGSNKEVLFFPGAEDGLMVYTSEVLPALRDMVAVETLNRKDSKVNDIVASLDDDEKAIMLRALTK